ncbi:HNH endonuclease [Nocardioides sp. AX2bis]|uniref:HNH endonuclease n=1 Tax=Nocardioides sp. AX2bis TaxID=2653157 RepID=UPI0012F011A1|nr:DUF222 domain-containing protein [Nocardioides sp. AX2bis]VXB87778.1 HNH endonuclease [Nocardioides sp. AX2bis]
MPIVTTPLLPAADAAAATWVSGVREEMAVLHTRVGDDAGRVEALRALEELKSAAAAAQARITAAFATSQRAEQAAAGVPAARRGRGVGSQVGLARRESPHRGQVHLGLAGVLVGEMPHTLARMTDGLVTEFQATLLARETAVLTAEQRALVDEKLCADPATLDGLGDRGIAAAARRLGQKLDPAAAVRRAARAASDRRVTTRPMPDTMVQVSALLPVAQGVAVFAALKRAADSAQAGGDPRGRGQVMADTLVERVTGQVVADAVPVAVHLVGAGGSFFGGTGFAGAAGDDLHEPVLLPGYGTVPAAWARDLLVTAAAHDDSRLASWIRRIVTDPRSGAVVAMSSTQRGFPEQLADLVAVRDAGICRTPWCDAPIRHSDHVVAVAEGGPTSEENAQGLCAACNWAKEAPGWTARPRPGPASGSGRHEVVTTTPTGHEHASSAPRLPGARWPVRIAVDYVAAA